MNATRYLMPLAILLLGCTPLAGADDDDDDVGGADAASAETDLSAPSVQIATPNNGDALAAGEVAIVVSAIDDVGVTDVEIYLNDAGAGYATLVSGVPQNGTYQYLWNASEGTYRIKAIARDASGKAATDDDTEVTIGEGDVDPPPTGETHTPVEFEEVAGDFAGLGMHIHVPPGMDVGLDYPLVIVLHGCWEDASVRSTNTEWNQLADAHKFYVIHAENAFQIQQCFDWWSSTAQGGAGEAAAVLAMIDTMKATYGIDEERIFLDGFSAGGGLGIILLANYPDTFAAAAIHAGLPFRGYTGTDVGTLGYIFSEHNREPAEWAALMPSNPGTYPPILAFYGTTDGTVHFTYTRELVEQWTEVHQIDREPDNGGTPLKPGHTGHVYEEYRDTGGNLVIATVALDGMGHGYAVDPDGAGDDAGGSTSGAMPGKPTYAKDHGLYSAYYAVAFFGID
jgi:poly(hydroxyalkanoate) depolymerase family esterase